MFKKYAFLLWVLFAALFISCSADEDYTPVDDVVLISPVVLDINSVPYQNLSTYNFYDGPISNLEPVYGVLPYNLINPLFTDYAEKERFLWMPSNVKATYINDHQALDFPVSTVLIKNFYYDNVLPEGNTKIIETRIMIRKNEGWIFANYVWNDEQSDATLDMSGSITSFEWIQDGITKSVDYRVPAGPECHTCHKLGDTPIPVGPKPRNLNINYDYDNGSMNQLAKLIEMNYLEDNLPDNIETTVSWKDASQPLNERARSYIDANCAHCHSENSHCDYRPMRFDYSETDNPENLGICVEPDTDLGVGQTHIINPANQARSMLFYRISSTDEEVRMPLLGRTLVHDEGVQLISEWIGSLENICE
jgi:uncharacterized repeat protein (TIGR03806 family)